MLYTTTVNIVPMIRGSNYVLSHLTINSFYRGLTTKIPDVSTVSALADSGVSIPETPGALRYILHTRV